MTKASHREFTTGFYFNKPTNEDQNYQTSAYTRDYSFIGMVKSYDAGTGIAVVEQRNKMVIGDEIEVLRPGRDFFSQKLDFMQDEEGNDIESAPHPQQIVQIRMKEPVAENFILRKRRVSGGLLTEEKTVVGGFAGSRLNTECFAGSRLSAGGFAGSRREMTGRSAVYII